jgi:hypothetical protein
VSSSRQKQQGTAAERRVLLLHRALGLLVERLPEGGPLDLGDLKLVLPSGREAIIEVKDREVVNVRETLEKAVGKAKTHRLILFVTLRVKLPGRLAGARRKTRRFVVLPEHFYFELVSAAGAHGAPIDPRNIIRGVSFKSYGEEDE